MMDRLEFLCIGEPLVEFTARPDTPSAFDRRMGGDTLNTAVYLARLLGADRVGYLSCIGDDPHGSWLRDRIGAEGVDIRTLTQRKGGHTGLSFVSTDGMGERSFSYWREYSPFRSLFSAAETAPLQALNLAPNLFLSGVTLAVLHQEGREALLAALADRREAGACVVLDMNYRPSLWPDPDTARQVLRRAAPVATLLLPSLDDMIGCFGAVSAEDAMRILAGMSDAEIVLTAGGQQVLRRASGQTERHDLPAAILPLDTTGAGDSFNAAWLVARSRGMPAAASIAAAARLASTVIRHQGAIIPVEAMPSDLIGGPARPDQAPLAGFDGEEVARK